MDEWHWVRFNRLGVWKDNEFQTCEKCGKRNDGTLPPEIKMAKVKFLSVDQRMKAHDHDIHSRVIGDDGDTVLRGEEGLKYMKKNADKVPGYANRLKDYYKL